MKKPKTKLPKYVMSRAKVKKGELPWACLEKNISYAPDTWSDILELILVSEQDSKRFRTFQGLGYRLKRICKRNLYSVKVLRGQQIKLNF